VGEAKGFFLVYSATSRESFDELKRYHQWILDSYGHGYPIMIVANKCDLAAERQVTVKGAPGRQPFDF